MRYKQITAIGAVLMATFVLLAALMYYFNQGKSFFPPLIHALDAFKVCIVLLTVAKVNIKKTYISTPKC